MDVKMFRSVRRKTYFKLQHCWHLYIRFILQRNFFVIEMEPRLLLYFFFNVILLSSARNFDLSSQFDGFKDDISVFMDLFSANREISK